MVNSSVGGIGSRYIGSDVSGAAVRRGLDGSVSEDEGGSVSGDRVLNMSSQVGYVKSGVGGNTVRGFVNGSGVGDGSWEIENLDN